MRAVCASCWGVERVGLEDNFFALGGDSIVSIQLVSRARRAGLSLTPRAVFQHQTVAALAAAARAGRGAASGLAAGRGRRCGWRACGDADDALACGARRADRAGSARRCCCGCRRGCGTSIWRRRCRRCWTITTRCGCGSMRRRRTGVRTGGLRCCRWARCGVGRACGGWMRRTSTMRRLRALIAAARLRLRSSRLDPAAGVLLQAVWFDAGAGARGPAAAGDPSSGGGRGVVADPGAGPCGGVAALRRRRRDRAACSGAPRCGAGRSGLRRMRGARGRRRSCRSGAACWSEPSLRCSTARLDAARDLLGTAGRLSLTLPAAVTRGAADAGGGGVPRRHQRGAADRACACGGGLAAGGRAAAGSAGCGLRCCWSSRATAARRTALRAST